MNWIERIRSWFKPLICPMCHHDAYRHEECGYTGGFFKFFKCRAVKAPVYLSNGLLSENTAACGCKVSPSEMRENYRVPQKYWIG